MTRRDFLEDAKDAEGETGRLRVLDHTTKTVEPYIRRNWSQVTSFRGSVSAWAINIRSKGSR
jgi:hypothetical protein